MRIAVTGASDTLGGHLVELLAAHDDHEVLAVSRRSPSNLPPRVLPAQADYSDRATLQRAFDGIDTLVFVSSDGEAANVLYHHHNVIHAAPPPASVTSSR
jgi:NAD(P)H dehydrogenase (quinone)